MWENKRLSTIGSHVQAIKKPFVLPKSNFEDCWSYFGMDKGLSKTCIEKKQILSRLLERENPNLIPFIEKAEFPFYMVEELRKVGINGFEVKGYGSPNFSTMESGAIFYELGKYDTALALFLFVQCSLGIQSIDHCCLEEQKQRFLPDLISLKKFTCFALTEPNFGSDATSMETTAKKVEGGYILNGHKRWQGNALFSDQLIIWAKNVDDQQKIQGFIVEKGSKGLRVEKIQNKAIVRMIPNCDIYLNDVFVPDQNKMGLADDFTKGVNKVLERSRIHFTWAACGIMAGSFEAALKYSRERIQFGKPIAGFQLTQEKLVRCLGEIQASIGLIKAVTEDFESGKVTMGKIALAKAHISRVGRDVVRICREIFGGNGVILDNLVMKHFIDMEGVSTGEGTYDVNVLLTGREITGIPAFK